MDLFGKDKPTQFDEDQNKALKQHSEWLKILAENNNSFIKTHKDLWAWITKLKGDNEVLLKRVLALEAEDKRFKQQLANLVQPVAESAQSESP